MFEYQCIAGTHGVGTCDSLVRCDNSWIIVRSDLAGLYIAHDHTLTICMHVMEIYRNTLVKTITDQADCTDPPRKHVSFVDIWLVRNTIRS